MHDFSERGSSCWNMDGNAEVIGIHAAEQKVDIGDCQWSASAVTSRPR
ncbi:MAG: hypothetical protein M2R45_05376 [Verrucomicrobia subdivision 3 bacterium]|nr:hypothetical protein [Limisphaerales bacterium]